MSGTRWAVAALRPKLIANCIPVEYWIREVLMYASSEKFPQGELHYLEQIFVRASDAGFYIIIDLHGVPGAQVAAKADIVKAYFW